MREIARTHLKWDKERGLEQGMPWHTRWLGVLPLNQSYPTGKPTGHNQYYA